MSLSDPPGSLSSFASHKEKLRNEEVIFAWNADGQHTFIYLFSNPGRSQFRPAAAGRSRIQLSHAPRGLVEDGRLVPEMWHDVKAGGETGRGGRRKGRRTVGWKSLSKC